MGRQVGRLHAAQILGPSKLTSPAVDIRPDAPPAVVQAPSPSWTFKRKQPPPSDAATAEQRPDYLSDPRVRKVQFEALKQYLLDAAAKRPFWDLSLVGVEGEIQAASTKFALIFVAERWDIRLAPFFDALPNYVDDPRAELLAPPRLKAFIQESGRAEALELQLCGSDKRKLLLLAEDKAVDLEALLRAADAERTPSPRTPRKTPGGSSPRRTQRGHSPGHSARPFVPKAPQPAKPISDLLTKLQISSSAVTPPKAPGHASEPSVQQISSRGNVGRVRQMEEQLMRRLEEERALAAQVAEAEAKAKAVAVEARAKALEEQEKARLKAAEEDAARQEQARLDAEKEAEKEAAEALERLKEAEAAMAQKAGAEMAAKLVSEAIERAHDEFRAAEEAKEAQQKAAEQEAARKAAEEARAAAIAAAEALSVEADKKRREDEQKHLEDAAAIALQIASARANQAASYHAAVEEQRHIQAAAVAERKAAVFGELQAILAAIDPNVLPGEEEDGGLAHVSDSSYTDELERLLEHLGRHGVSARDLRQEGVAVPRNLLALSEEEAHILLEEIEEKVDSTPLMKAKISFAGLEKGVRERAARVPFADPPEHWACSWTQLAQRGEHTGEQPWLVTLVVADEMPHPRSGNIVGSLQNQTGGPPSLAQVEQMIIDAILAPGGESSAPAPPRGRPTGITFAWRMRYIFHDLQQSLVGLGLDSEHVVLESRATAVGVAAASGTDIEGYAILATSAGSSGA